MDNYQDMCEEVRDDLKSIKKANASTHKQTLNLIQKSHSTLLQEVQDSISDNRREFLEVIKEYENRYAEQCKVKTKILWVTIAILATALLLILGTTLFTQLFITMSNHAIYQ